MRLDFWLEGDQGAKLRTGQTLQLRAKAFSSDGITEDVTSQAVWTSSNASVATVSAGVVTAVTPGLVTITATFEEVTRDWTIPTYWTLTPVFSVVPDAGTSAGLDECEVTQVGSRNQLKCTFDGTASKYSVIVVPGQPMGSVIHTWNVPAFGGSLGSGAQLTHPSINCGALPASARLPVNYSITITGVYGEAKTVTKDVLFIRAGAC